MALTVFLFIATLQGGAALQISPVIIAGSGVFDDACPSDEERENARLTIINNAMSFLNNYAFVPECGDGLWYRVAYLNMTDPTQQCPSAWRLYDTSGARACGRNFTRGQSCPATSYQTGHQYSKVCGRLIGYQFGSPDAFNKKFAVGPQPSSIDEAYVDGVSITHAYPRAHIWTFAATNRSQNFPCLQPGDLQIPMYIENNYFCESGNSAKSPKRQLYSGDPLWDGKDCEGQCCSDGKSPPWFNVEFNNTTTDDIEVRICGDQGTPDEDAPIQLMEIYIS